ncbi:hypothetical protein ABIF90_009446 [Bradyrhizobium japonicum]
MTRRFVARMELCGMRGRRSRIAGYGHTPKCLERPAANVYGPKGLTLVIA